MSETFQPTEEQQAVIDATKAGGKSLMVKADAGCAKTTTLKLLGQVMKGGVLGIAFNKSTANELQAQMPGNFVIKTANGLGHGAWIRANPGVSSWKIETKKLGQLITQLSKDQKLKLTSDQWGQTRDLVTYAMQNGLTPDNQGKPLIEDSEDNWREMAQELCWIPADEVEILSRLAKNVLMESIALARKGVISFDDQIYCSVCLGGRFTQFEDVISDESQDLNLLNHQMIAMSTRQQGRIIAVGDPKQSIYGFRGAVNESMEKLRELKPRDSWVDLPLHLTFRCPKVVVRRQQGHAPGFTAYHKNPEGQELWLPFQRSAITNKYIDHNENAAIPVWRWEELLAVLPNPQAKIAILCRNNAPLMKMAFKLIRRRVSVMMLGRNLGKNLTAFSRKIMPDDSMDKVKCAIEITRWKDLESASALAVDNQSKLDEIYDRAGCLEAVLEDAEVRTAGEMREVLRQLFDRESGQVTLGTGHKAKGLEWDVVVHLDSWRIPSRQAKEAAKRGDFMPLQQDKNLGYVIETRTRHTIAEANLEEFR